MKFDYSKITLPHRLDFFGGSLLKPIIPIRIEIGGRALQYAALIDSGADFCIFHREIGEALRIDIERGVKLSFGGIQQADFASAYLHDVDLIIGGWSYKTTVGFSGEIADESYGILGQKGFFDIFIVKFDFVKEEIELRERSFVQ